MKILYTVLFLLSLNYSFAQLQVLADADFESTFGPMTFSSNGNQIWQIGVPAKPFFGTAFSPPNAIMTDSINSYPPNNTSSFILNNTDSSWGGWVVYAMNYLSFMHKYQTTQYHDGCSIEVSYDGTTWQNFLTDTFWRNNSEPGNWGQQAPDNYGMYSTSDTLYNLGYGFSGTSNGWIQSGISWVWWMAVSPGLTMPDSMFIRFTFYRDSTAENLDGWMIDNIYLTGENGSGIAENIFQSSAIFLSPQPSSDLINIYVRKGISPELFSIYDLTGKKIMSGIATSQFSINANNLSAGMYRLAVETEDKKFLVKPLAVIH